MLTVQLKFYRLIGLLTPLLLAACGAENSSTSTAPSLNHPAPAAVTKFSVDGQRGDYEIGRTANNFYVKDLVSNTGTSYLNGEKLIEFSDMTVNLEVFVKSKEISEKDLQALIELYIAFFNRVPDANGMSYWIDQLKNGASIAEISKSFYGAALAFSSVTGYSASMSNADFVKIIYKNVLGRNEVDAEGLAYWSSSLSNGSATRASLIATILNSAHTFKGDPTYGYVADLLDNKIKVGLYFAIQQGLSYKTDEISIQKGMAIANAITPTDYFAAIYSVGLDPHADDLTAAYDSKGKFLIRVWRQDGTEGTTDDFVKATRYLNDKWSMYGNYGFYKLGQMPGTPQVGGNVYTSNVSGTNYITFDLPSNQKYYLTVLWLAPNIGTVFMHTDNNGAGYSVTNKRSQNIELPFAFVATEYAQLLALSPTTALSSQLQNDLHVAKQLVDKVNASSSAKDRALASYEALGVILPLKEKVLLEISNKAIAKNKGRSDFDMNYEGFGGWIDTKYVDGYLKAKEAGFRTVMSYIDWKRISPTKGTYDFSYLDYEIDQAIKLGYKVALNVNNANAYPDWIKSLSHEELKSVYFENARATVNHYGEKISWYYITAEMELETSGRTLKQQTDLAEASLNGARSANAKLPYGIYISASAYVAYQMNPSSAPNYFAGSEAMRYLIRRNINFDFVGLEMQYGTTFAPIDLQRFQQVISDFWKIAKVPIYMGETGYSSKTEEYGIASNFYWRSGLNQQSQYDWADGTLRILYAMPNVKGYYWVHLDPDNYDYGSDYLSTLVGTNLLRADGQVKPVFNAFKNFKAEVTSVANPTGK